MSGIEKVFWSIMSIPLFAITAVLIGNGIRVMWYFIFG
jgi:hypothetical protein